MAPKISVVIPTYNEEKDIAECIKSLESQTLKDFEIIIVDDGSTDSTLEILKKFKKIKLIRGEHKGPGYSRNLGARDAKGKILVFVDADMTFEKNYLRNLVSPILNDKFENVVGTTHEKEIATNPVNYYSILWGEIRVDHEKNPHEPRIFRAIRKNKFFELGSFDPKYGYADDQTFYFKYKIIPVVAKGTLCYHKNPENFKGTFRQARWIGASWKERFLVFRIPVLSHLSSLILFLLLPFIVVLKSTQIKFKSKYSFFNIANFYIAKSFGYAVGVFNAVFLGIFEK